MADEMLEILIGKYLDGEITARERRMLEAAMEEDPQARKLFEQLQDLDQRSRQAVASEIRQRGKAAEEIFEQAWQQRAKRPARRMIRLGGYMRFAAGLAAGLIIGLGLHFSLLARPESQGDQTAPNAVTPTDVQKPALQMLPPDGAGNVFRNVDWYSFTDEAGDQWLIEGFRENIVRPAAYRGGL